MIVKQDKRSRVAVLKSAIELSELMIKTWTERSRQEFLDINIKEQEKIISDAQSRIDEFRKNFETASDEIKQLRQSIKYDLRQLVLLENAKLIEKLKKMKEFLEIPNEKDNTDKET